MKKTFMLRKYLDEEQLIVTAGAFDALSAKIIENAGFKVALLSGFGFEASLLGKPDVGLLTMTEVVSHARNIASAVQIPVLADAEAGYGGPGNIQRTIREFEAAGVAGIFIEDQRYPTFCGTLAKYKQLVSKEEMVLKIKCALEARTDPDFLIGARTDADIISLDEQIVRCNAYAEAGADLVTLFPKTLDEFRIASQQIRSRLWLYLAASIRNIKPKHLRDIGIRGLVIYPVETLFVATTAMMRLVNELKEKGTVNETFDYLNCLDYKQFFSFIGLRQCLEVDQRFPFTKK